MRSITVCGMCSMAAFASFSEAIADEGAAAPMVVMGTVRPRPVADTNDAAAARFRLPAESFTFQEKRLGALTSKSTLSLVTFPSPVTTPHEQNNTVHCEYFCPQREGKAPAVVVLHILGGDFPLARLFCNALANRGVNALLLKMPYYGPRRAAGVSRRMISRDPRETVEGMTQAILDIRRAADWLAARDEVDPRRLGVFGISLGGITGALAAGVEPRFENVCLMLAGGDLGQIVWEAPQVSEVRQQWLKKGGTQEEFYAVMSAVDPVKYAASARGRRILMLNATNDEIIPRRCTESLWREFGEPEIVWYEGGHYTVARHLFTAMQRVATFFEDAPRGENSQGE